MVSRGVNTYKEIKSQPQVWKQVLEDFNSQIDPVMELWDKSDFSRVIFTGCGSTHYLSITAASVFNGITYTPASCYPASELVLFPGRIYSKDENILLVAVSRSGETTETVEAVSQFKQRTPGNVLAITCDTQSSLAKQADFILASDAAQEVSIAQTRSFTSMLILAQAFAGRVSEAILDSLPGLPVHIEGLISRYEGLAEALGENLALNRLFFLGSGYLYGIASEAMLKMKEMSLTYSEVFHTLEFRHGPMSMVDENSLVVGLISEKAAPQEAAVLKDMRALGAKILYLSEAPIPELDSFSENIILDTSNPEWMRPVVYLPALQLLAYYRSMAKGLNPDQPTNLDAVVKLSSLTTN